MKKPVGRTSKSKDLKNPKVLQAKVEELTADLQRLQADFANFRRRAEQEQTQVMSTAKEAVVMQILPLLDNIERALGHMPKNQKPGGLNDADQGVKPWMDWANGVTQIARQIETTLKDLGLEKIAALNQPFNPTMHEAVGMDMPNEDLEDEGAPQIEIVTEELQTGYRLGERVLRPSMVRVGKKLQAKGR
jgi:molecular chaperone GrpE